MLEQELGRDTLDVIINHMESKLQQHISYSGGDKLSDIDSEYRVFTCELETESGVNSIDDRNSTSMEDRSKYKSQLNKFHEQLDFQIRRQQKGQKLGYPSCREQLSLLTDKIKKQRTLP